MKKTVVTFTLFMVALLTACASSDTEIVAVTRSEAGNAVAVAELVATQVPPTLTPLPIPTQTTVPTEVRVEVPEPTQIVTIEPTASPLPTEEPVVAAGENFGRTADGGFYIGKEDAAVTIIDYSDFL